MFIVQKNICLIIVPKILPQSITSRATLIQTLVVLNACSTQMSHGAIKIRINMLEYLMDRTNMLNHLDFISKIKSKETPIMIN